MRPGLAGFREPGFRFAGQVDSSGGGGGSSAAADITIVDAGNYYTSTNVEGALQEAYAAVNLRAKLTDLAATTAGKGASLIGTHDASLLIGGLHPTVEDSLVSISADVDTALSEVQPIVRGGTGQITASAAFDALTVTAPALTSAATVDLSLAGCPGHYAIVNGNTGPITSFGTAPAGTERILRFASTPTVTHNAVSLILPGGADITMAAGDVLFLHSLGSGNWRATSYLRAASLPAYSNDLASTTASKGASLIGLQDAGAFYGTKNVEFALQQLGPLGTGVFTVALSSTLTDAGTNTAPDLFTIAHRSSATPVATFGLTVARELDSSTKTRRRALAEVTQWTTATDGAETATHTYQLRTAGALTNTLALGATSNFPTIGSAAAPTLTVGTVGDLLGFYRSSSGELGFAASGARLGRWSSSGLLSDTIYVGPLGSAPAPTFTVNGTTGGSGLYGITGGSGGLSLSVLNSDVFTALKAGNAFKLTALVPGANNTASTEFIGFELAMGRTSTWSAGALTTQREVLVRKPTYAFGSASTITSAATLAIEGPPVAGSNATITNNYALWSQAGTVRFDLSDAATTTAPDGLVLRHATSATAAAGFGFLTAVELQSAAGNNRRAMSDLVKFTSATDTAEAATRTLSLIIGGALTAVGGFGFAGGSGSFPTVYVGDPASGNGMQKSTAGINFTIGATNYMTVDSTSGVTFPFRAQHNRGAGVAAATTITLGTGGNTFPVSAGTGTINSIVASSWQSGSRIVLECVSGITITHNVGGTGATILTPTGASIVTSTTRAIPLVYNGTNWIVEG